VLRENYDAFIQQLTNRNKARARDQFSKLVLLSSGIKADVKHLSELIPIVILSSISIFLIAFTVSVLVSRSISRPLKQLTQGAEIIGSGNFEHKTALRGNDEISDLSRSFDSMTERLRTTTVSRDALRQEVAERKRVENVLHNKNFELERLLVEHQRTETALRASEALLDRFVAEAPVGLVIFDADRRLLRTNKTFCELTGYPKGELLGHTSALYAHPDDLPATVTLTDQCYRGERDAYTYETRYVRNSGEIIWVSVNAIRIELPDHPGPVQLAVVQDITAQKRAMEEREQLSQDLHDDLLQSLYAVGMQLEACKLASGTSPLKSKSHLTYAIDQLNYQVRAIRQFITLLKQPIRPKPSFAQALRQLIVSFSAAGQAAPTLELDDSVLACINAAQGEHLLKIAREAISNSMRHAQATHRGVRFNHTGDRIRMVIWDDGVGFASWQRRRRGEGLKNMSARAEKIRARLTLESTPGQGTRVTVDVPRESRDGQA
jgi:PAS domain S-box-containing protein